MSKRKPPVPRRRIGANLVDFTIRQPPRFSPGLLRTMSSAVAADRAHRRSLENAAAGTEPDHPISVPSSPDASSPSPAPSSPPPPPSSPNGMDTQQGHDDSAPVAPHVDLTSKPVVATVPLSEKVDDDTAVDQPSPANGAEMVTMTVAELEQWKQRTVMQIEDFYTNEQLKRIAEFGRVHANLVKEAKEYVCGIETQLKQQFERERESLRQQAEAYVAQFQQENEQLREQVEALEDELEELKGATATTECGTDDSENAEQSPEAMEEASCTKSAITGTETGPVNSPTSNSSSTGMQSPSPPDSGWDGHQEHQVRLEDVTETMSRAMGLQTPRAPDTSSSSRQLRTAPPLPLDAAEVSSATATSPLLQPQTEPPFSVDKYL